jgi:hypothetical protein
LPAHRHRAPRQVVRNASHRVNLVVDTLEAAGFEIASDIEELDNEWTLFDCLLPADLRYLTTADNPQYEKIIRHQVDRARRALSGFRRVKVEAFGWRLTVWISGPNSKMRPGRPVGARPAAGLARAAKSLLDNGDDFVEIARKLGEEFNHHVQPESWRKLLNRYYPPGKPS